MVNPRGAPASPECPRCGATSSERVRRTAEATHGSIAILAEGVPVDRCGCGNRQAPVAFTAEAATACATAVPVSRARRLRPDACVGCGAAMSMPVRRSVRAVTVSPTDGPVTTLQVDLPMQRCADCGLDQLPVRSEADLLAAIAAVVDAAVEAAAPTA
jgi:hypothetical protein